MPPIPHSFSTYRKQNEVVAFLTHSLEYDARSWTTPLSQDVEFTRWKVGEVPRLDMRVRPANRILISYYSS